MEKEYYVFGLAELSKKVPELLKKQVENKSNPEKWTWKPHDPKKIKNIVQEVEKEKKEVDYTIITNYEPSDKKQNIVLVFAIGNLSYGIINQLKNNNLKFFFIDFVRFIFEGEIKFIINDNETKSILNVDDVYLDLDDVSIVIWNTPKYPFPLVDFEMIPQFKGRNKFLFKKRWKQSLKEISKFIRKDAIWIPGNPFVGSQEWQDKISELNLAKKIGFNVPETILTNKIGEAKNFAKKHSHVLLREFSTPPFSFPPIKIDLNSMNLSKLKNSPCCFQEYIEKEYEIRAIVLFERVFGCKIYSQDSELAKDDWRVHDDSNVKWELIKLPENINSKLINICKELNLTWCSVDLILSKNSEYYFLELNRPGAHYWLAPFIGLDITKEIIMEISKLKVDKYE